MKLANLRDMFKKAYKGVCKSTIVVSSDTMSLAPTILAIKSPEHTEENPNNPEPAMKKIPKWNTPLISCTVQIQEQEQKITCKTLHHYKYHLIIIRCQSIEYRRLLI
jgi:hypothetical protein